MDPGAVVVRDRENRLDISLAEDPSTAFEVVTPVGRGRTWTRKQAIRAVGTATVGGREIAVDGVAMIDDNDGYHPRLTQ